MWKKYKFLLLIIHFHWFQYILLLILTSDSTRTTWRRAESIRITHPIIVVITTGLRSDSLLSLEHSSSDLTENTCTVFKTFLASNLCRTQFWIMNVNILIHNSREIKMEQDKTKQNKAKLILLFWLGKRVAIKWWKQRIKSSKVFCHSLLLRCTTWVRRHGIISSNVNTANKQTTVSLL